MSTNTPLRWVPSSHYASDIAGHPAVNQAVAIEYPKLRAKYGKSVRYAQDKSAHLKTEFGFDTVQVAKNRYASQQYHDFIGFQVSKPLLERVFPVVYGMQLKDVLTHEDMAVGSYRFAVSRMIPEMTQVALQTHKKDLMHETPNFAKQEVSLPSLALRLRESSGERTTLSRAWALASCRRSCATCRRLGPSKDWRFNNPTPQTEDLYFKSINMTVDQYRTFLEEVRNDKLVLANSDLDSGQPTKAAEYSLTDDAYAKLLAQLSDRKFDLTSSELRDNILQFYSDPSAAIETKRDAVRWQNVLTSLDQLRSVAPVGTVGAIPAQ